MSEDSGDRSALRARLASRPPPAPDADESDAAAERQFFANLAEAEARDYADPRMRERGKPLIARVAGPASRAAGDLSRRWGALVLAALQRWSARLLAALQRRGALVLSALRGALPTADTWREARTRPFTLARLLARNAGARLAKWFADAWVARRPLMGLALALLLLGLVIDALQAHGGRGWNSLLRAGAEMHLAVEQGGFGRSARAPASSTEPAPRPRRYVLAVVTRPAGAVVTAEGATFETPGEIVIAKPEPDLRVKVSKAGHRPFVGRVTASDFARVAGQMRCTLEIALERGQQRSRPARAARAKKAPKATPPQGPTPLEVRPEPAAAPAETTRLVPGDPFARP